MASGPLAPVSFITDPQFQPVTIVVGAYSVAWYLRGVRRVARRGQPWAPARTVAFVAGVIVIFVSATSGLAAFATSNFTAAGFLYLSLGLVGPGLVVLGAPLRLAEMASVSPAKPSTAPAEPSTAPGEPSTRSSRIDSLLANRAVRAVSFPVVTWVIYTGSVLALFFTGLFGEFLANLWVRQALTVVLVAVGLGFWWVVAGVDRSPWRLGYWQRILYLMLTFPVFGILGMTLQSERSRITSNISLASLHLGAAVLWVAGETVALYATISVFAQWLRNDEKAAQNHDRDSEAAAARQLALWRASRDAAARAN